MKNVEFITAVVLTVLTAFVVAVFVPGKGFEKVELAISYSALIITFLVGFLILVAIATGKIDISKIIAEDGGGASMSRFQLLVFTLVISLSFLLVVVSQPGSPGFPNVPPNVLALLGVSASTYGVSKGIQASGGLKGKGDTPPTNGPASNGAETKS